MPCSHEPYYKDRRSVSDLCYDFPADEPLIEGLHAMQVHFLRNGVNVTIPIVRVMNGAHYLAAYMFSNQCSGDQLEYDVLAYASVGHDKQVMLLTMIVLSAILNRTDGFRAHQCRNVLLEDRTEDFYEGVSLYEQFITNAATAGTSHAGAVECRKRFSEQDFMTDVMAELTDMKNLAEQLINEKLQLQNQLKALRNNEQQSSPIIMAQNVHIDTYNDYSQTFNA